MDLFDRLCGNLGHQVDKRLDRDCPIRSDVDRAFEIGAHQPDRRLHAFVDVEKTAKLRAVAPDFDRHPGAGHRNLPADRSRGLFAPIGPRAFRPEHIVVAGDPHGHAVVSRMGGIKALREQLFPPIVAVWICGIGFGLAASRASGRMGQVGIDAR